MKTATVYLIHFDKPYHHARHYLGSALNLENRIAQHRAGTGARLMEVISEAGIGFTVARTWRGDRKLERKLKNRKKSPDLCPLCKQKVKGSGRL